MATHLQNFESPLPIDAFIKKGNTTYFSSGAPYLGHKSLSYEHNISIEPLTSA